MLSPTRVVELNAKLCLQQFHLLLKDKLGVFKQNLVLGGTWQPATSVNENESANVMHHIVIFSYGLMFNVLMTAVTIGQFFSKQLSCNQAP